MLGSSLRLELQMSQMPSKWYTGVLNTYLASILNFIFIPKWKQNSTSMSFITILLNQTDLDIQHVVAMVGNFYITVFFINEQMGL